MAKKDSFIPEQQEFDHAMQSEKTVTFSGVPWENHSERVPIWSKLDLKVFDKSGNPIPGMRIMMHYRPPIDASFDVAKISFALFFYDRRIFALDPYPASNKPHRNKSIVDHPDYLKSVRGPHYHLYFPSINEEIGLSLDTDIPPDDLIGYWNFFCGKLNIKCIGSPPLPNQENSGQLSWEM